MGFSLIRDFECFIEDELLDLIRKLNQVLLTSKQYYRKHSQSHAIIYDLLKQTTHYFHYMSRSTTNYVHPFLQYSTLLWIL